MSSLQASAPAFPSAWNPFPLLGGGKDAKETHPKEKEMQNQSTKEAKNSPQDMCYRTHFTGNATEPREVKKRTRGHTAWRWRSQVFCLNSTSPKTPGEGFEDQATALLAGHGAGPSGSEDSGGGGGAVAPLHTWSPGLLAHSGDALPGPKAGAWGAWGSVRPRSRVGPGRGSRPPFLPARCGGADQQRAIDGVLSTFQALVIFVDSV